MNDGSESLLPSDYGYARGLHQKQKKKKQSPLAARRNASNT